jgi:hypothetical protein
MLLEKCIDRIQKQPKLCNCNQSPLQQILNELSQLHRDSLILAVSDELRYSRGRFVKHFIQPDANNWTETGLDDWIAKIQMAIQEVCQEYIVNEYTSTPICNR